jgi:putative effector of murein hydrolase LrgA (UPF0299 family)
MKMQRILRIAGLVTLCLLPAAVAFAAPGTVNPGERIGQWLYDNVVALFVPVLAIISIYYLAKRQFTQFISFAVFAVLVSLFVFAGNDFKDAAVSLSKWIIGR